MRNRTRECAVSSSIRRRNRFYNDNGDRLIKRRAVSPEADWALLYARVYTERPEEMARFIKYIISHAFLFLERIWFVENFDKLIYLLKSVEICGKP